jgi:hypothetical protein
MNAIRTSRSGRRVSLLLAVVMVSSLLLTALSTAMAEEAHKSLLVFPLTVTPKEAPLGLSGGASSRLSLALGDLPGMNVMQFTSSSPTVLRAISEGRLRQVDVDEGNRSLANALMIGEALKADFILLGTIQSYVKKDDPASVEVIMSGQMYEVAPNVDPVSGEAIASPQVYRAFGVSGASTPRVRYHGSDSPLIAEALSDAANKAAQALSSRPTGTGDIRTGPPRHTSSGNNVMLLLLAIGGLALLAGGAGGGGGNANADAAPPTNLQYNPPVNGGVIYLSWNAPSGTLLTLNRYQIERKDNGGSFSGSIDPGTLFAGTTTFADSTTSPGHTYQYRLRAIYTSGAQSVWVYTTPLTIS